MFIRLESVSKSYGIQRETPVRALRGVTLELARGEFAAVLGPSGCGKTTLLSIVGLLSRPTSGKVLFDNADTSKFSSDKLAQYRGGKIGFVFQAYHLLPRVPAWRNVALPLAFSESGCGAARDAAMAALAEVGLEDRAEHKPAQLSGGEKQRVAVARALIRGPALILADEPTGNLDSKSGREIIALIRSTAARHGSTVLLVTHDRGLAENADRILEMADGRVTADIRANQPDQNLT